MVRPGLIDTGGPDHQTRLRHPGAASPLGGDSGAGPATRRPGTVPGTRAVSVKFVGPANQAVRKSPPGPKTNTGNGAEAGVSIAAGSTDLFMPDSAAGCSTENRRIPRPGPTHQVRNMLGSP